MKNSKLLIMLSNFCLFTIYILTITNCSYNKKIVYDRIFINVINYIEKSDVSKKIFDNYDTSNINIELSENSIKPWYLTFDNERTLNKLGIQKLSRSNKIHMDLLSKEATFLESLYDTFIQDTVIFKEQIKRNKKQSNFKFFFSIPSFIEKSYFLYGLLINESVDSKLIIDKGYVLGSGQVVEFLFEFDIKGNLINVNEKITTYR